MQRPPGWDVVLPVKGGPGAKSRLGWAGAGTELALAMAADCLQAVRDTPAVRRALVVTGDPEAAATARAAGAVVVPEPPVPGLAAAVAAGAAVCDGLTAVLLADLPCLTAQDLAEALAAVEQALGAGSRAAFVPDADDVGTVLLAAASPQALRPAFGGASARAHEDGGARRLALPLARLRRDVDTVESLREAVELGVGPRTAATLEPCRPRS